MQTAPSKPSYPGKDVQGKFTAGHNFAKGGKTVFERALIKAKRAEAALELREKVEAAMALQRMEQRLRKADDAVFRALARKVATKASKKATVEEMARAHSAQAIGTIVATMADDRTNMANRITAADTLLNRAHGKPGAKLETLNDTKLSVSVSWLNPERLAYRSPVETVEMAQPDTPPIRQEAPKAAIAAPKVAKRIGRPPKPPARIGRPPGAKNKPKSA